jgi:trk system potassium uptake protein
MFILILGAGRVGSSLARAMLREGHEVSCLDEDHEGGQFTVGTGLEIDALIAAGIERADVFVASTDGDNTNIIVAQIAKRRFSVPKVIARVLDPYRAEWYEQQGLHTISPTRVAIDLLEEEVRQAGAGQNG